MSARSIIFYDGECGLCNGAVRFALKRDRKGHLAFAPIGGSTWQDLLGSETKNDLSTMHFFDQGRHYRRSAAVVRMLWKLGAGWSFVGSVLWVIPLPIRNLGYRIVAATRYKLFGRVDSCALEGMGDSKCMLP